MSNYEVQYITVLENIKNYPLDRAKDLTYMKQMEVKYPNLDLVEAIKKFSIYILGQPFQEKCKS